MDTITRTWTVTKIDMRQGVSVIPRYEIEDGLRRYIAYSEADAVWLVEKLNGGNDG